MYTTTTIENLLKGQAVHVGKNSFSESKDYVQPFLDFLKTRGIDEELLEIRVMIPKNLNVDGKELPYVYHRMCIIAPIRQINIESEEVIGCTVILDKKKPLIKYFYAARHLEHKTLLTFNAANQECFDLLENAGWVTFDFDDFLNTTTEDTAAKLNKLEMLDFDVETAKKKLGVWVYHSQNTKFNSELSKCKVTPSLFLKSFKDVLFNKKHPLHNPDDGTMKDYYLTTACHVYEMQDFSNMFEKTWLVGEIMAKL